MIEALRKVVFKIFRPDSFPGKIADKLLTREIFLYIVFGVLTTAVNFGVYTVLVHFVGLSITVSNAVAWVAGVLFAFVTNKLFVFESRSFRLGTLVREFLSFVAARAATGVLEIFGVPALVKLGLDQTILGVKGAVSKAVVSVAVIILNYVFSKLLIFRKKKQ